MQTFPNYIKKVSSKSDLGFKVLQILTDVSPKEDSIQIRMMTNGLKTQTTRKLIGMILVSSQSALSVVAEDTFTITKICGKDKEISKEWIAIGTMVMRIFIDSLTEEISLNQEEVSECYICINFLIIKNKHKKYMS